MPLWVGCDKEEVWESELQEIEFSCSEVDFDTVFKERVWELCYENQTWFDMLRTRKAYDPVNKTVVNFIGYTAPGHSHVGSGAFTTTDLYIPYPVREKRLNPNLKR